MTPDEAHRVTEIVRLWLATDRAWWRALLDHYPQEAMMIAPLILMDAHPVPRATIVEAPE